MKLPNGDRAVVDLEKIQGYCLNPGHPRGRHKARVFEAVLGITPQDGDLLMNMILRAAATEDALRTVVDKYGQRYVVDFDAQGPGGQGRIRSAWIVLAGEDFPRLVSCFVM